MAKPKFESYDKSQLLELIADLQETLSKKKLNLAKSRSKLATCRARLQKAKKIIDYQRSRILFLYNERQVS